MNRQSEDDRGGGGVQGRNSVSQILCEIFVRNLFSVYKDLHGDTLGCAFAHLHHAKGFGLIVIGFPWKSRKCSSSLSSFVVFLWHSMGRRQ